MSIADKLIKIAEKEQKVYDAGYQKGKSEGGDSDAAYEEGYTEGYAQGKAEDLFQHATYYNGLFRGSKFPPNFDLIAKMNLADAWSTDMSMMFYNATNLKSIKLIDESGFNGASSVSSAFRGIASLKTVDLTEFIRKFSRVDWLCLGSSNLKSIYGALDFSECTTATLWINGADALEDIEFVPNTIKISIDFYWCAKLTKASLTSIINGLSADTSGLTVTLSKTAVNNAFGGTDSAEWLELVAIKPNWTISLI